MEENIPNEYKPVSIWLYLGIFCLSMIPCVGLIGSIVLACGAVKNKNITNFARAQLILGGIIILLWLILFMIGVFGGIMGGLFDEISRTSRYYY